MRNSIKYTTGVLRFFCGCLLITTVTALSFTSCVNDIDANSKSVANYTNSDIKSYGDLFNVFWSVMNQRYCGFNEQVGISSLDWEQVYNEYKPKFDSLKTFQHSMDFTQEAIQADNALAKEYFQAIVDKIIDQHYYVKVTLPLSYSSTETVTFRSTLAERPDKLPLSDHFSYTHAQLAQDSTLFYDIQSTSFYILGGFLKSQPGTYYLGFSNFLLNTNCLYDYKKSYLPINAKNNYHLDSLTIANKAQELASAEGREAAEQLAQNFLAASNRYLNSEAATLASEKMAAYSNDGNYYDMNEWVQQAYNIAPTLFKKLTITKAPTNTISKIYTLLMKDSRYKPLLDESNFSKWFLQAWADYLWREREFYDYWTDLTFTQKHTSVETYRRKFLEPLKRGDIQKLILDLRGNGGGYVQDTRLLTDYLVSKTAVYAYMRKKEDNNPYSYTPWVPQQITVTPKSLGRNIPTAILIDNGSASMSEATTLILKSQGDHAKAIGRNSYGAQSMLTADNTASSGGWNGAVTNYLYFYMPYTLTKDAQGNLLESVGITPDYLIDPMTTEELQNLRLNTEDAIDRAFEKAKEILK